MTIRLQILPPHTLPLHSSFKPSKNPNPNPNPNPKIHRHLTATATITSPPPSTATDAGLRFREKLLYLQALNVNPSKALHKNPNFRSAPLSSLKSVENCLSSMGIEHSALGRILDMYPQLLTSDPDSDLYPVFDFLLNDAQIPFHDVRKSIIRCPRLLICSVETQLRPTLRFLDNLGFVGSQAINCQTTVLLVSSVEGTLMPKLNYLMELGFSYEEVRRMVLRSPGLLTFSIANNYRPKVEYFLKEMDGDLVELKKFPQYFSFSLEGKIKPRHRMLVEKGFRLSLPEMLKVSDGEFHAQLIEMRMRVLDERVLSIQYLNDVIKTFFSFIFCISMVTEC